MSEFTVMATGLAFPEGPVVMPDGSVVVVEIKGGTLRRIWGDNRSEVIARPGGGPNGAQLGPDGAIYVCNNGGIGIGHSDGPEVIGRIERIDPGTGRVDRLYDHCDGRPLRAPNDLVFDADGGIWFTDMGRTKPETDTHPGHVERSAVHYCRPDGSAIHAPFRGALSYNGIGLSPDGRTLYVAETQAGKVWRFGVTGPGELAADEGGAVQPEWFGSGPGNARFDSLALSASGTVCVATIANGGITSLFADGRIGFLPLPETIVTNIAFGGPGLRTAYITLAGRGDLIAMAWPEAGLPLNFGYGAGPITAAGSA